MNGELCEYRRAVLVREPERPEDEPVDITPKDYAVRSLAQEYGGGAFRVSGDTVIFSNYKDQRLYKQSLSSKGDSYIRFCLLFKIEVKLVEMIS